VPEMWVCFRMLYGHNFKITSFVDSESVQMKSILHEFDWKALRSDCCNVFSHASMHVN
jgi:hypothetical protein